jgi:hypothetical protein
MVRPADAIPGREAVVLLIMISLPAGLDFKIIAAVHLVRPVVY